MTFKAQRDIKLNPLLEHEKNSKFLVKFLGYNNLYIESHESIKMEYNS
jgi:hypothetical protein